MTKNEEVLLFCLTFFGCREYNFITLLRVKTVSIQYIHTRSGLPTQKSNAEEFSFCSNNPPLPPKKGGYEGAMQKKLFFLISAVTCLDCAQD